MADSEDEVDTVADILVEAGLLHLVELLREESATVWMGLGRLELLKRLKAHGVSVLAERQGIANMLGRKQRTMHSLYPQHPPQPSQPHLPPPAPEPTALLPVQSPVFDSATDGHMAWSPPLPNEQQNVRAALLLGAAKREPRDGSVCVCQRSPWGSQWTKGLGECGD